MSRSHDSGPNSAPLQPHELRGPELRSTMRLVTVAWIFGAVWVYATAGTPVTNFANSLGASNFQFGILAALPFLASFLNIPGTLLIEATGKRKRIFLCALYFQRLMWIPLGLVPLWMYGRWGDAGRPAAIATYLALLFLMHAGNAIGGAGWIGWMSDLVPPGVRGTYFSRRRQWGLVSAIPAAWAAGWVLDRFAGQSDTMTMLTWCSVVYVIACAFGVTDIAMFHWVPDVPTPPKKGNDLFTSWGEPLHNRNYLRFAGFVGTLVFAFGPMGQFVTLYIVKCLGANATGGQATGLNQITQLMLIVAPSVAQLLVLHIWGKAADRMGKRPVLILAALGLVPVGIGWCFVTADRIWLGYLLSALGGALWAGIDIVNFNIVLEFSGSAAKKRDAWRHGLRGDQCDHHQHCGCPRRVCLGRRCRAVQGHEPAGSADRRVHILSRALHHQWATAACRGRCLPSPPARAGSPADGRCAALHDLQRVQQHVQRDHAAAADDRIAAEAAAR